MGGAADAPQRSSSPLKRRASDLEGEAQANQKEDVDMVTVPDHKVIPTRPGRRGRAQSVDMLKGEADESYSEAQAQPNNEIPPIDVQIKSVTAFCEAEGQKPLEDGATAYLVSRRWLARVQSRSSEALQKSKTEPEGEIGPVDNSDLIEKIFKDNSQAEFAQLKNGVGLESFQMFPLEAWELVIGWYGLMPGQIPIIRVAHNTNPDKNGIPNTQYELNPPIFVIRRLWSEQANAKAHLLSVPIKAQPPLAPIFVFSRATKNVKFLTDIKKAAGVDISRKISIWRIPQEQPAAEPEMKPVTPPASPPSSGSGDLVVSGGARPSLLIDVESFVKLEGRERVEIVDYSVNKSYNGSSDIAMAGLGDSQTIIIDELVQSAPNVEHVSTYSEKLSNTSSSASKSGTAGQVASQNNTGRNSPSHSGAMLTRGRAPKVKRTPGTIGLSNLGNTCYMNSALQCVRSVQELTQYFLSGAAAAEINTENPLGWGGDIAHAYNLLLNEIYTLGKVGAVTPRYFKNTIGRHAPSFSGYGQQDSQEFLGFLLDGLQEDLSRIKKKPYIEKPDSTDEMVNDPEAIRQMAAKVWEITKKRDDSVIADLFTGMYKSTLICPVCAKVSITFDPFNNVTLQLPIENSWSHSIFFFPLHDKPVTIVVDIDKQATVLALKQYISKKVGVPVERLILAEEFKNKIYKIHNDSDTASEEISTNDTVAIYELEAKPTNWPSSNNDKPKKKFGSNSSEDDIPAWDSPMAESMVVPVFYRVPTQERSRFKKQWEIKPVPHFIIVTSEEASSSFAIKRKILEKLATLTTHPDLHEEDEDADSIDPDLVLTMGSDSSGDSKVVANSIDGEDELVDVTMKDLSHESLEKENIKPVDSGVVSVFNKRRPKFVMNPKRMFEERFKNLFELCYFAGKELVPTGWNAVDEDTRYPTLSSRSIYANSVADTRPDHEIEGMIYRRASSGSSESGNEDTNSLPSVSYNTQMTDEAESDEDEDELTLNRKTLPLRSVPRSSARVGSKYRKPALKTYSRKGIQSTRKQSRSRDSSPKIVRHPPLIRLGEGIIVDWNLEAYCSMFEGTSPDDHLRGQATWQTVPTLDDPELTAKKHARSLRRKNGISLDDCLDEFGKEEVLSEQDTWYCPRCKEHRRATKKFELWKTPDILIMHLKRFSSSGWRRDKLDVLVDFPIENLDLTSRVIETEDGKSEIYDLFAVDDHWGGLGGGHYTAFAKNYEDQKWYEYNDSSVTEVREIKRVVSASAYLLFYRRRSEGLLGGPKFLEILRQNAKVETSEAEDDEATSGEGQGLDANSSLRGSSSALTGVGAAHHRTSGSGVGIQQTTTVNPQELSGLPDYQAHETDEDAAPLLRNDAAMNSGLGIRRSIEEDEGVDMGMGFPSTSSRNTGYDSSQTWSLGGLLDKDARSHNTRISGRGSEIDLNDSPFDVDGSDIVQADSSASPRSLEGRLTDFETALPVDDDGAPWEDPSPVPDIDDDNQIDTLTLHRDLMGASAPQFHVHAPDENDQIDEPATEIHLEPDDELKMD